MCTVICQNCHRTLDAYEMTQDDREVRGYRTICRACNENPSVNPNTLPYAILAHTLQVLITAIAPTLPKAKAKLLQRALTLIPFPDNFNAPIEALDDADLTADQRLARAASLAASLVHSATAKDEHPGEALQDLLTESNRIAPKPAEAVQTPEALTKPTHRPLWPGLDLSVAELEEEALATDTIRKLYDDKAQALFGKPFDDLTADQRQAVKNAAFVAAYGVGEGKPNYIGPAGKPLRPVGRSEETNEQLAQQHFGRPFVKLTTAEQATLKTLAFGDSYGNPAKSPWPEPTGEAPAAPPTEPPAPEPALPTRQAEPAPEAPPTDLDGKPVIDPAQAKVQGAGDDLSAF